MAILSRLGRIEKRLTQLPDTISRACRQNIAHEGGPEYDVPTSRPRTSPSGPDQAFSSPCTPRDTDPGSIREDDVGCADQFSFDDMRIPPQTTSADAILAWPVLKSRYPPYYLINSVFQDTEDAKDGAELVEPSSLRIDHQTSRGAGFDQGVNADEIPELVRRFLVLVHSKNPILDIDTLWRYVDRAAENGFTWDAATCIVVRLPSP